mmetsp:Transcript_22608/g.21777  ORF Transcript_22608/g.21777 Transcript_22608/m.21777 type:complete len:118 (-) Transcript_22608:39-392(-)
MSNAPTSKKEKPIPKNIKVVQELLLEEEFENTENLEYWIDYIHEFGIDHKIPRYDHMGFLQYHNLDLLALLIVVMLLLLKMVGWCLGKMWACCCRTVIDDSASTREKRKKGKKAKNE